MEAVALVAATARGGAEVLDDPSIGAVAVEDRNHQSLAMAAQVVAAGKHLWYDKPAGDDLPAFKALVDEVQRRGLYLQMGYMFRYSPGFGRVAELVHAGQLGEVFSIRAHMSTNVDLAERTEQSRHHGGILYDLGGHMIDQIVWLLGRPERASHRAAQRRDAGAPDLFGQHAGRASSYPRALVHIDIAAMEARPRRGGSRCSARAAARMLEPFDPARRIFRADQPLEESDLPKCRASSCTSASWSRSCGVLRDERRGGSVAGTRAAGTGNAAARNWNVPTVTELPPNRNRRLLCSPAGAVGYWERRPAMNRDQNAHVLIVEDELLIRACLAEGLEDAGYQVDTAPNGAEALARIVEQPPDACCSTCSCPSWTGWNS